ncbi:hypothetical protein [Capnocytophaga leadbetteri]|uniref:hypothetical protein n=1 Tax=Capnocytophaga leadbetteri TaxID=327575 RepID=UPI0026EF7A7A|nr:hypothetical protein [Capnocytophaga leadbetteri]
MGRVGQVGRVRQVGQVGQVGRVEVESKIVYFSGIGRYSRYFIFSNILVFLYRSYIIPILFV